MGAGKRLRHLEATQFFLQGLVKQGVITIRKVKGTEHVPDIGTKYLAWSVMEKLLKKMDVKLLTFAGASLLPVADGVVTEDDGGPSVTIDIWRMYGAVVSANEMLKQAIGELQTTVMMAVVMLLILKIGFAVGEKCFDIRRPYLWVIAPKKLPQPDDGGAVPAARAQRRLPVPLGGV